MNIWRTGSEALPTRREPGSFYFKDARGSRPALSRMPDIAVSYLRSFPSPIPVERDPYGIYRMALHFPRWSEIIDMDGCSKNILPGSVGCTLHLLYCFQPASEFQRSG